MAESFDAYYKWLGIPPEEQPPNYYRLLGVRVFEADLDVIANAADQRMTHVRTFQSGKHGSLSQSLLNEISAAKLCLLQAPRRAEYDGRLRMQLASMHAAAAPPPPRQSPPVGVWQPGAMPGVPAQGGMPMPMQPQAAGRVVAYPGASPAPSMTPAPQPMPAPSERLDDFGQIQARSSRRRPRQKKTSLLGPAVAAVILVGVAAGGALWFVSQRASNATATNGSDPTKRVDPTGSSATGSSATGQQSKRSGAHAEHASDPESSTGKDEHGHKTTAASTVPESALSDDQRLDLEELLDHLKSVVTRDSVQQTAAVGGEDGEQFREIHKGALLVGLDLCFETESEQRPVLCGLTGLYANDKGPVASRLHGAAGNVRLRKKVVAKPGYALAAVDVVATDDRVAAIRFEFRAFTAENLPKQNAYLTSWVGEHGSGVPVRLGGDGRPVIGLFGWASPAAINSLGLLLPPKPAAAPAKDTAKANPVTEPRPATEPTPDAPAKPPAPDEPVAPTAMASGPFSGAKLAAEQLRAPIPGPAEQARALGQIHELFTIQYAELRNLGSAKTPQAQEKRIAQAEKLYREAERTDDDPVVRYVLFDEARKLAVQAGDSQSVFDIILGMGNHFAIDDVKVTLDSFTEAEKITTPVGYKIRLAENCLRLIDTAVQRGLFGVADQLELLASKAAKTSEDTLLLRRISWRKAALAEQRRAHDDIQAAVETLKTAPDDAAANTAVGRYRCLVESDWATGLPLLAKGDDPALAALAKDELAYPATPADRVRLADSWLGAVRPDDPLAGLYKGQAQKWFRIAWPELSGVTRMTVAKKLEELLGGHGLTAEYFDGAASFENPVRAGVDAQVDMNYKGTMPDGLASNKFTVRWTGWLAAPPKPGSVTILVDHDAGARLWIDGKPQFDGWAEAGKHQAITQFFGGKARKLRLEYFSAGGKTPHVSLRWMQRDSFVEQPIGPEALFQEKATGDKAYAPLPFPLAGRTLLPDAKSAPKP